MTLENNKAPLLYYAKLCASFLIHRWIQTWFTETLNSGYNQQFLAPVTLKLYWRPRKTIGHLLYITLSFMHHLKTMGDFKLELQSEDAQLGLWLAIFVPCDLEIRLMTSNNNRVPLLYYVKLCESFNSHHWIQTGVTVRQRSIWVKIDDFFKPHFPLVTSSFVHHFSTICEFKLELQSWVLISVTLTFDLWPWPVAWTSCLSMLTTPENFRMMRWEEHCQKGDRRTDRQTNGRTEISVLRAAWSQLEILQCLK